MSIIIKGGVGSGIRGHVTIRDRVERLSPAKRTELSGKLKNEINKRGGKSPKTTSTSSVVKRLSKIDREVEDYFKKMEKDNEERAKLNPIKIVDRIKDQESISDGKQWVKSLDKNERAAVEEYRVSWDEMRDADRKDGKQDPSTEAKLNALYNAITKAPEVSSPIYRGLTMRNDIDFENLKVGKTFTNSAISSFTTNPKVAELFAGMNANSNKKPFVLLECNSPKKAYSIESLPSKSGSNKSDKEALVPKGVKYKIVGVEKMSLKYGNFKLGQGNSYSGIKIRVEEI